MMVAVVFASVLSLPVRVDGEGYLRFVRDGRIVYATSVTLEDSDGVLCAQGLPLTPVVKVPANATRLAVDLSGVIVSFSSSGKKNLGQIVLARFATKPTEDHGFYVSLNRASLGNPGEGTFGVIRSTQATVDSAIPPPAVDGPTVAVNPVSEVAGEQISLGDIATVTADGPARKALEAVAVGPSPAIGVDIPVTAVRIKALLKRAGIEADVQVPQGAVIRRKAQEIGQDDFVSVATKAAQEKIGATVPLVATHDDGAFRAPVGAIELKPENVVASGTNLTVTVAVYIDDKRFNSRTVNLKPDASAQVMAGASVKIEMRSAGVSVEVPGRTRTGGMIGQTVTVVTETGSVLTGIVVGADKVEVKLK